MILFRRPSISTPLLGDRSHRERKKNISAIVILLILIAVIVLILVVSLATRRKDGCRIYPLQVDNSPIVVLSGTNDFIYPNVGETFLRISPGQSIDFICPGLAVTLAQSEIINSVLNGICVSGSTIKIANEERDWTDLKCTSVPSKTIRYTGNSCASSGREIEVGFEVGNRRFIRSLLICFNQELQIAYYSYVKLPASINQRALYTKSPRFQQGSGFYNIGKVKVDNLYLQKKQKTTINGLLGLPSNSNQYIQEGTNFFLSRGHMTAKMDNFYAAQQNATFYFQNAAPQWQTFNGYNWNQIEIDVRDYVEKNAVDLQVWTGIYGTATLPHSKTGQATELYLFVDQTSNRKALPVPEIFWKVVYNPVNQHGIALIGVNNPYKTTFKMICQDVSQQLTWLHWDKNNQQQGFCYACSVDTFRTVVTTMPNIIVKGLLL